MVNKKKTKKMQPRKGLGQKERKFLHVKEFSQGKPNELSFNVLEKKAATLDEQPSKFKFWRKKDNASERPSLPGTLAGVEVAPVSEDLKESVTQSRKKEKQKGSHDKRFDVKSKPSKSKSSESSFLGAESQAEIKQRQHRRKLYRRLSIAVVILICIGCLGAGGYWFYQEQVRLSTSVGALHEACDIIAQSDEVTISIDTYFQTSFNDETVDTATNLIKSLPDTREDLDSARVYAQEACDKLEGSQRDKEAAEHVLATIVSRETMLSVAEERMNDDIKAKQAINTINQAQSNIDEGNALLAQAAQVVSDTTEEHVAQSTEYTTSAKAKFEEAKTLIQQAQTSYSSADFTSLLAYIDKKSEAAGEALTSNAAILIQDKATAEAHNDAYNSADAEASTIADSLPSDLTKLVVDAYAANQAPLIEEYEKARSDASTHDAYLRDYLGTNS